MSNAVGKSRRGSAAAGRGKRVVQVSGFVLLRVSGKRTQPAALKEHEKTPALLRRIGRALDKPGIAERLVRPGIYTYAAYPPDPTKVIQKAADGTTHVGRLTRGRFTPSKEN